MSILASLKMNQVYKYLGIRDKANEFLSKLADTSVQTNGEYKLRASSSLGTMRGLPVEGINVIATIKSITEEEQHIQFTT